jgi:hypothetical protein
MAALDEYGLSLLRDFEALVALIVIGWRIPLASL